MNRSLTLSAIALAALTLAGCGSGDADDSPAVTSSQAASATSTSVNSSADSTTSTPPSLEREVFPTSEPALAAFPAQSEMIQHGANADTINIFEDSSQRFWICDKRYPNGSPELDFYAAPNGCAGPYGSLGAAQAGFDQALANAISDAFSDSNTEVSAPSPTPINSEGVAQGIAESMGCESAVFNDAVQGYEYEGCQ